MSYQPKTDYWTMFAAESRRIGSPLYERLSAGVGGDDALRHIANHAKPGQPGANLLFGSVHYLLLGGIPHPLALHYPSLHPGATPVGDPFPLFREFCLQHETEITRLVSLRITNTNEVARSTSLYPAFDSVASEVRTALHMVEIGPSAGFNLNWDRYGYVYSRDGAEQLRRVPAGARLVLRSELKGTLAPHPALAFPEVASRVGLELNPVNLQSAEDRLWLKALIMPELAPRIERLQGAIDTARAVPPPIQAGDALSLLGDTVAALPASGIPVIYHSFVTYQFSSAMRNQLEDSLLDLSMKRTLVRVSIEWNGTGQPLIVSHYHRGEVQRQTLADCSPHGAWLDWQHAAGKSAQQ